MFTVFRKIIPVSDFLRLYNNGKINLTEKEKMPDDNSSDAYARYIRYMLMHIELPKTYVSDPMWKPYNVRQYQLFHPAPYLTAILMFVNDELTLPPGTTLMPYENTDLSGYTYSTLKEYPLLVSQFLGYLLDFAVVSTDEPKTIAFVNDIIQSL